jgi:chlorite dismutase
LSEKGAPRGGAPQSLNRRLFISLQAFGGCTDAGPLVPALKRSGVQGVLYAELNDPRGVGLLAMSEDPEFFAGPLRRLLGRPPFSKLGAKPEFAMLGRTYSTGYEPDLQDHLLARAPRIVLDPRTPWALWYPLRRTGAFSRLSPQEQGQVLREHGALGRQFGESGFASDIRLASAGLDKHDNDFTIGIVGAALHPLSALVAAMRKTIQTSRYIEKMGPFFVGRALWQAPSADGTRRK